MIPRVETYERWAERAAIIEHATGYPRDRAEWIAAEITWPGLDDDALSTTLRRAREWEIYLYGTTTTQETQ